MYPVPRHAKLVISEWAEELAVRFGCTEEVVRGQSTRWLSFPNERVRVELTDGSHVEFECAFFLVSEAQKAIALFTEHCGHHVFPYHEAKAFINGVSVYDQQGA